MYLSLELNETLVHKVLALSRYELLCGRLIVVVQVGGGEPKHGEGSPGALWGGHYSVVVVIR